MVSVLSFRFVSQCAAALSFWLWCSHEVHEVSSFALLLPPISTLRPQKPQLRHEQPTAFASFTCYRPFQRQQGQRDQRRQSQDATSRLNLAPDNKDVKANLLNATTTSAATNSNTNSNNNNNNELVESLGKAAWQVGSDFFVALRWGAANALTAALPEDQRKVLLERMDPEPPKYLLMQQQQQQTAKLNQQQQQQQMKLSNTTNNATASSNTTATALISTNATKAKDDDDDGKEDDTTSDKLLLIKNSINEAVAVAVAVTSQRENNWDQDKAQILAMAQDAATQRVATDLAIQKQRLETEQMQLQLEEEEAARQEALEKELAVAELSGSKNETSGVATAAALDTSGYQNLPEHPVLGKTIQDLGYKRMHLVPAELLATIPVWKKQRIYRHERAKAMAADKLKTLHLGLPGVICLHEEDNGKLSILDGQHRVGMMKILLEKQHQQQQKLPSSSSKAESGDIISEYMDLDHVLVEVYPQTDKIRMTDHAQDIFMEINKAEPIKLVDMPGVATSKDRNMISQAVYRLEDKYPAMFSPSQRCRAPNVNVDNLRDNVFAANVIKRHNLKNATQLLEWLLKQNDSLGKKYISDTKAQEEISATAWKKASSNEFYLGLESSWLYT